MHLLVLTPRGPVMDVEADSIILPLESGFLGVKKGHQPLAGIVVPGGLFHRSSGEKGIHFVSGGVVEVSEERVLILTDAAEEKGEIDLGRAEKALERATLRLKRREAGRLRLESALNRAWRQLREEGVDRKRLLLDMDRALERVPWEGDEGEEAARTLKGLRSTLLDKETTVDDLRAVIGPAMDAVQLAGVNVARATLSQKRAQARLQVARGEVLASLL